MEPAEVNGLSVQFVRRARFIKPGDEFFQDGNNACFSNAKHYIQDDDIEHLSSLIANFNVGHNSGGNDKRVIACEIKGCKETFITPGAYEVHFLNAHKFSCAECGRSFPSNFLLDIHISENHDSFFQARRARGDLVLVCLVESCPTKFKVEEERNQHLVEVHKYPSNFRFNRTKKRGGKGKRVEQENKGKADAGGATDDMEVEETAPRGYSNRKKNSKQLGLEFKAESADSCKNHEPKTIPKTINFGRGSSRAFHRGRGMKKK